MRITKHNVNLSRLVVDFIVKFHLNKYDGLNYLLKRNICDGKKNLLSGEVNGGALLLEYKQGGRLP